MAAVRARCLDVGVRVAALYVERGGVYFGLPDKDVGLEYLTKVERSRTPLPFRDLLLSIARGARSEVTSRRSSR